MLDKDDADAEEVDDAREAREDEAAKDMFDVIFLLLTMLPPPKERRSDEQEIAAVIM